MRKGEDFNLMTVKYPSKTLYQDDAANENARYRSGKENGLKRSMGNRPQQKFQKKLTNGNNFLFNRYKDSDSDEYCTNSTSKASTSKAKSPSDKKNYTDKNQKAAANKIHSDKGQSNSGKTSSNGYSKNSKNSREEL